MLTIKNEKGLSASHHSIHLIQVSDMQKLVGAVTADATLALDKKEELLGALGQLAALPIEETEMWTGDYRNHRMIKKSLHTLRFVPSGWVNETQTMDAPRETVERNWAVLRALDACRATLVAQVKKHNIPAWHQYAHEKEPKLAFHDLPSASAVKKLKDVVVEEAGAHTAARAGRAFAIWMGAARTVGYMDTKKNPAGAAGARLFESAAAAERTARAARFGDDKDRGPAAIVELAIEPVALDGGAGRPEPVLAELARLERDQLQEALESASLDRIRSMLGEASAPEPEAAPLDATTLKELEIAGAQDGWAVWMDYSGAHANKEHAGFLNQRDGVGPLVGAVLHESKDKAERKTGYWHSSAQAALLRVTARPVAIASMIGAANVAPVELAIDHEMEVAQAKALKKANADSLRERAKALESGAVQPVARPRAGRRL
jgi:hypothetical protein